MSRFPIGRRGRGIPGAPGTPGLPGSPRRPRPTPGPVPPVPPVPPIPPGPEPGTTFTLTPNSDTATANLFNGPVDIIGNFALNTLTNGDRLTGTGVNPTLDVTLNVNGSTATTITPAALNGIETLKTNFVSLGSSSSVAASTISVGNGTGGFKNVEVNSPLAAFSVTNIGTALNNISISNVDLSGNAQTFAFSNAALAGSSDAVTVTLNNVTSSATGTPTSGNSINLNTGSTGTSNYETINVVSTGQANVASFVQNTAGVTTLKVSGSADYTTSNLSDNLKTFDATAATGAVTFTETRTANANAAYLGGTGNNLFNLQASYASTDTVNGGSGGVDTLRLTGAQINAGSVNQTNASNLEVVELGTASSDPVTVTPAFFGGANTFSLAAGISSTGAPALTANFSAGTGNVDFNASDVSGGFTASVAGTATNDVLNILVDSVAATPRAVSGATTLTNYETINIVNGGTKNAIFGANGSNGFTVSPSIGGIGTVNVTGTQGATFTGSISGVASINASAITGGNLDISGAGTTSIAITGSNFADTIKGSTANDIISGLAGNDTINGGGGTRDQLIGGIGNDIFQFDVSTGGTAGALSTGYTVVGDFTVGTTTAATDFVSIDSAAATYSLLDTRGAAVGTVAAGSTAVLTVLPSTTVDASGAGAFDLIKIAGGVTTSSTTTAEQGFQAAIAAGSIDVSGAGQYAVAYYDSTNSQAVIGIVTDTTSGGLITNADTFNVLTTLQISQADYNNFGTNNLSFF